MHLTNQSQQDLRSKFVEGLIPLFLADRQVYLLTKSERKDYIAYKELFLEIPG